MLKGREKLLKRGRKYESYGLLVISQAPGCYGHKVSTGSSSFFVKYCSRLLLLFVLC